ncbi:MAG: hypothetical protein ACRD15_17740 [Vicinamibacterales bacterium]
MTLQGAQLVGLALVLYALARLRKGCGCGCSGGCTAPVPVVRDTAVWLDPDTGEWRPL